MSDYILLVQTSHPISCSKKELEKLLSKIQKDTQVTSLIAIEDLRREK